MTAAERRGAAWDAHRAFLANVTGWPFWPPVMDHERGVIFSTVQMISTHEGPMPILVQSVIRDRDDVPLPTSFVDAFGRRRGCPPRAFSP